MVRLTLIARLADGLPLAEGLDSDKDAEIDQYKLQAKVCAMSCRWVGAVACRFGGYGSGQGAC
jgi:hypothetical protein